MINLIVVEIWYEQLIDIIALKFCVDLGYDLGIDMYKRTNVIDRGDATTNPFGIEIRSKTSKLD